MSATGLSVQDLEQHLWWGGETINSILVHLGVGLMERVQVVLLNCRSMNIRHNQVLIPFDYSGHHENNNSYY